MAYRYHCGVHETDAGAMPECGQIQKEHHLEEHAAFRLDKAVVGHNTGKRGFQVLFDEEQIVVFEVTKRSKLKGYQNGHYFTV